MGIFQNIIVVILDMSWKDPLEKSWLLNPVFLGFPCDSAGTESASNVGDLGLVPGM